MTDHPGSRLHEIGPYIGKIRPSLARMLVGLYTKEGQYVWDPFCGSGTIPLEARLAGRHVIASDVNPYARLLTRAKLSAPHSAAAPLAQLASAAAALQRKSEDTLADVPDWVRRFFHERTLHETRVLLGEFLARRQYFNAGCLLGILHHQRPGFLSYPASHLVPYLRDRLFPRDQYPEAYDYRDPVPRLEAKIRCALEGAPPAPPSHYRVLDKAAHEKHVPSESVQAVITSPPYMDALDYARDNRLRLWFLGVTDYRTVKRREIGRVGTYEDEMRRILSRLVEGVAPGGVCILILGMVARGKSERDVPGTTAELMKTMHKPMVLEDHWVEDVPDRRRARRNGRATRAETILVFRRGDAMR